MVGETILHYKIIDKIGAGGMGVVYKAEDTKLKRTVAIKFLPPEMTENPDAKERFIQEARAASALDHPNICTIYEINETDDGQLFIVMAYYVGKTLQEKIDTGPMSVDDAVSIAINISEGLHEAHENGVVHRDIKPANIMITDKGQIKIMDFGLAKSIAGSLVTKAGTTLGTVGFMSPEQTRGSDVDRKTDIWSLGVVLYAMLAGKTPFKGEYEQAIIYSILNVDPEPLTGLRTDIPVELEQYVNKCITKDPEDRYPTATGLTVDLRRMKKDTSRISHVSAIQESPPQTGQVSQITRESADTSTIITITPAKRKILTLTAAALLVAVVAFAVFTFMPGDEIDSLAILPFINDTGREDAEYLTEAIPGDLTSSLQKLRQFKVISFSSILREYRGETPNIRQVGEDLGVKAVMTGRMTRRGEDLVIDVEIINTSDASLIWSEQYVGKLSSVMQFPSMIARDVSGQLEVQVSGEEAEQVFTIDTTNPEAWRAYQQGMAFFRSIDYTEESIKKTLEMFSRAVTLEPDYAQAWAELSRMHSALVHFNFDLSEERLALAKAAADRAAELQPGMPEAHLAYAYYHYWGNKDYDEALIELSNAEENLPNDLRIYETRAYIQRRMGDFEGALRNLRIAMDLSPRDLLILRGLGGTLSIMRDYEEAESLLKRATEIMPGNEGTLLNRLFNYLKWDGTTDRAREVVNNYPGTGDPSGEWIGGLWDLAMYDKDYQEALDILSGSRQDVIRFAPKPVYEGWTYFVRGETDRARIAIEPFVPVFEENVKSDPDNPIPHYYLALMYLINGRNEDAVREGEKMIEVYPVSYDALAGAGYLQQLVYIYTYAGEYEKAIDNLEYLLSIPSIVSVPVLRNNPAYDPLRGNPRFEKLLDGGGD